VPLFFLRKITIIEAFFLAGCTSMKNKTHNIENKIPLLLQIPALKEKKERLTVCVFRAVLPEKMQILVTVKSKHY